jgi:hypothetical protein
MALVKIYKQNGGGALSTLDIGITPITGGSVGGVLFEGTGNLLQESSKFIWDVVNGRLGLGTNTPLGILHLKETAQVTRFLIDGDAGFNKIITFRTSGLQRFGLYCNNIAESGSNAGSDFAIRAYSDLGVLLSTPFYIKRSSGNVLINSTTDVPSSKLTIASTTQGFLPPRMTTAQKNAIASPSEGLVVYDNNLNGLNFYNGNTWTNGNGVHSIIPMVSGDVTYNGLTAITSGANQTGLTVRLSPYIPSQSITTSNLFINVTTATPLSLCTIVIYSDTNGVPTNLLYESADLDCSTTGLKTAITSFNFVAGTTYWLGLKTNGTLATRASLNISSSLPLGANASSTFISYQKSAITYASPSPNPLGAVALNVSVGAIVYITKA